MKKGIIMLILLLFYQESFSAPMHGDVLLVNQPDGSQISIALYGDEFYLRAESPDGYTVVKDENTGWYSYGVLNSDKTEIISSGVPYSDSNFLMMDDVEHLTIEKHIKLTDDIILKKRLANIENINPEAESFVLSSADGPLGNKLSGNHKGITILIDFDDDEATISASEINDFLNKTGYDNYQCNGSIKDYFYDASGGKLEYTNSVIGYYRAKYLKSYYTDDEVSRVRELIFETLTWLEENNQLDLTGISLNENNEVRAVNIFYSGNVQNNVGKGLWPHKGSLGSNFYEINGIKINNYQVTNIGDSLSMRSFVHETGHMLFHWPDLYDYGNESSGLGNYCIMAYGADNKNPIPPNGALVIAAGWGNVTDITNVEVNTKCSLESNSLNFYKYSNSENPDEYFIIESRIADHRNQQIPDEGVVIWHVDENASNEDQEMSCSNHYMVSIEQADGNFDLENYVDRGWGDDLFHRGEYDVFNSSTIPNSNWWCDGESGLSIGKISNVDINMSFNANYHELKRNFDALYLRGTFNDWKCLSMQLVGDNLWQAEIASYDGDANGGPRLKFDRECDWLINYGDNNQDFIADLNGNDILIGANKQYIITFNDETYQYTISDNSDYGKLNVSFSGEYIIDDIINEKINLYYNGVFHSEKIIGFDEDNNPSVKIDNLETGQWIISIKILKDSYEYYGEYSFTINKDQLTEVDFIVLKKYKLIFKSNFENLYFRGTPNSWGTKEMTLVDDYKWEIDTKFFTGDSSGGPRFKFDRYGDWAFNLGDNDGDKVAEMNGMDIYVESNNEYKITFYDNTYEYVLTKKPDDDGGNKDELKSTFQNVYFRGTANSWNATEMTLVSDYTWEIEIMFYNGDSGGAPRFKFDIFGDWTQNYGDTDNDYIADISGRDIIVEHETKYKMRFIDNTKEYSVEEI